MLQNIYLMYPDLIIENRDVYFTTQKIFNEEKQKKEVDSKLIASILLYWMSG